MFQETGWKLGVRLHIVDGLPTDLVQELNAGTVLTDEKYISLPHRNILRSYYFVDPFTHRGAKTGLTIWGYHSSECIFKTHLKNT